MAGLKDSIPISRLAGGGNMVNAFVLLGMLALMMLPVPPALLDVLLTFNITFAIVILLVTVYLREPLEFSVFPSVLLMVTLARLSLNVASTRLILSKAFAGEVIQSFGNFVVGGNYVIGFVIFLILIVIQFVVITKGAGRIAEVAARFTLDAMPGKQMSIDADLNAGVIDDKEARARREKISAEADFYGSMDGASKFVRGDAIAGIIITIINIIGGLVIGVAQRDLSVGEAARTYTLLTVGDGLVSQMPALIVSTAAGLVVTRSATASDLGADFSAQITRYPKVMLVGAVTLVAMGVVPGMPTAPFFLIALLCLGLYYLAETALKRREAEPEEQEELPESADPLDQDDLFYVDPLELEIGYGLIPLVDKNKGGDLLARLTNLRRQSVSDSGMPVAPIRVRDNVQLRPNQYSVRLKGAEIANGTVYPDHCLAMGGAGGEAPVAGIETEEPVFGLPAVWIRAHEREDAELKGYTVVESEAVIATHIGEIIKKHASEIMTRQDVKDLVDKVRKHAPAVVEDLVPERVSLGFVQQVLGNLLREQVPIKDMVTILEVISNLIDLTKDADVVSEKVREALSRTISSQYSRGRDLNVLSLDPGLEDRLVDAMTASERSGAVALEPTLTSRLLKSLDGNVQRVAREGFQPVLVCSAQVRLFLKRLAETMIPNLVVISFNEVSRGTNVKSIGMVTINE